MTSSSPTANLELHIDDNERKQSVSILRGHAPDDKLCDDDAMIDNDLLRNMLVTWLEDRATRTKELLLQGIRQVGDAMTSWFLSHGNTCLGLFMFLIVIYWTFDRSTLIWNINIPIFHRTFQKSFLIGHTTRTIVHSNLCRFITHFIPDSAFCLSRPSIIDFSNTRDQVTGLTKSIFMMKDLLQKLDDVHVTIHDLKLMVAQSDLCYQIEVMSALDKVESNNDLTRQLAGRNILLVDKTIQSIKLLNNQIFDSFNRPDFITSVTPFTVTNNPWILSHISPLDRIRAIFTSL